MIWKRDKGKIKKSSRKDKVCRGSVYFSNSARGGPLEQSGRELLLFGLYFRQPPGGAQGCGVSLSWKASVGCKSRCAITFPRFSPGLPISLSGAFQTVLARHS